MKMRTISTATSVAGTADTISASESANTRSGRHQVAATATASPRAPARAGDDGDDQRRARAGENETQEVTAEYVRTERKYLAGRVWALLVAAIDDEEDRLVWRYAFAE